MVHINTKCGEFRLMNNDSTDELREDVIAKITGWLNEKKIKYENETNTFSDKDKTFEVKKELCYSKKNTDNDIIFEINERTFITDKHTNTQEEKKKTNYLFFLPVNKDHFSVSARIYFGEGDRSGFILSPKHIKDKIRMGMKIPLLSLNLIYSFQPDPENFDSVVMEKIVYFDGFSKNVYFNAIDAVKSGYDLASTYYINIKNSLPKGGSNAEFHQ